MTLAHLRSLTRLALLLVGILLGSAADGFAAVSVPGNFPTIQAAIDAVINGSLPDGTTIDVQAGTYAEALVVSPSPKSFTVRGVSGPLLTIVDAAGKSAPALTVHLATGRVVFSGLTFRHGAPPVAAGGGFVITQASPSFFDCIIEANTASAGAGGAMFGSNATFTRCTIRNNSAARSGGGVLIYDGSRPVFTQTDIVANHSGTGGNGIGNAGVGGGIDSRNASPTFRWSRIVFNTSMFAAGGIYHGGEFSSPHGTSRLIVEDTEVGDNVASPLSAGDGPAEGGGIHIEDNAIGHLIRARILRNRANTGGGLNAYRARYEITDSVVDANQATSRTDGGMSLGIGGGITASSTNVGTPRPASIVNLTRSIVRNNVGITGGGVVVTGDVGLPATLTLISSVVDGNQTQNQGGGILISRTTMTATSSMINRNGVQGGTVPFGGGLLISVFSTANLTGTTIAQNHAGVLGGGVFMDQNAVLNMSGSRIYQNTTGSRGGGLFVGGTGTQAGTIQNSVIADNAVDQVREEPCSSVSYQNNTITGTAAPFSGCTIGPPRASGNNSNAPTFAHFLAAPSVGSPAVLAWSIARATNVNIPGAVSNSSQQTGTANVSPTGNTTFNLTAQTSSGSGSVGPLGAAVTIGTQWGSPLYGDRPVPADFDGDGKADIAIYRTTTGQWFVIRSSNSTLLQVAWGAPELGDTPVIDDYDGDGKADVAVYRLSTGDWFVIRSSNSTLLQVGWGAPNLGDVPVVGDYDGDGKADVAVYRLTTGQWFVIRSSNSTLLQVGWGAPNLGDVPVVGDYDGDGKSDVGVYRKTTGQWFIIRSSNNSLLQMSWGDPSLGDVPVPADYDGDGKTDPAVARPMSGEWFLNRSTAGPTSLLLGVGEAQAPADYDGNGSAEATIWGGAAGRWLSR